MSLLQALDEIEIKVWEAICELEKCIEHRNMTLAIHNMGHFARQVKYLGPIRETWAYGTESKLGNMKRKTFNKFLPGACIMQRQCYEESLRFLSRNTRYQAEAHTRREVITKDTIDLRGSPKRKKTSVHEYPLYEIHVYITENWKEYTKLVNEIGLDGHETLWEKLEMCEIGELQLERYRGRERGILGIPPFEAYFYKSFVMNGRIFETQQAAESKSRTSNCGVICKTASTQREVYGKIQAIVVLQVRYALMMSYMCIWMLLIDSLHLQFDHNLEIFLEVKLLKYLGEHRELTGIQVVSPDSRAKTIIIQMQDVCEQIFFSRDMTTGDTGQLLVHRKGNVWTLDEREE